MTSRQRTKKAVSKCATSVQKSLVVLQSQGAAMTCVPPLSCFPMRVCLQQREEIFVMIQMPVGEAGQQSQYLGDESRLRYSGQFPR